LPAILDILSLGIILLGCGHIAVLGYLKVARVEQQLQSGRLQLNLASAAITQKPLGELRLADFEAVNDHLGQAEAWFRQAQAEVRFFVPLLDLVGGDAGALPHLIDLAVNTSVAGQELYAGLEPLLAAQLAEPDNPTWVNRMKLGQRIIEPLLASHPHLLNARDHLAEALAARAQIDRTALSQEEVIAALAEVDEQLPRLYKLADLLAAMPNRLTNLLGLQKQKVYLILSQNNDELRPTGGWIGAYGVLVVEKGEIVAYEFHSSYSPILRPPDEECPGENPAWWIQLLEPVWRCFYAQWTADFPTLARQVEWFYEQGGNTPAPIAGVIAIDLMGMETLLAALGPVELPAYGEVIDVGNMRTRFYDYRARSINGEEEIHKRFLASMFEAVTNRPSEASPEQMVAILNALVRSLREKHLLLYFEDPDLAAWVAELNGDGAIHPTMDDYLFVVDSSLIGKVYNSIEESIEYEVMINPDGTLAGQVTINWFFPASAVETDPAIAHQFAGTGQSPTFGNMARVYIPQGSLWVGTKGNNSPTQFAEEGGKLMLGNWVVVAPGERQQIRHYYLVPTKIEQIDGRSYYRLTVQKQPGTQAHSLTVRVILPEKVELIASTPKASVVYEEGQTMVEFETRLATDQTFEVVFR
jgi:hypothetical protein